MASSNRQDRALMRQRGAGLRSVANTDFGLNFGFAEGREDRHRMRQRGAASRDVAPVDFGLQFPSSTRSLRSSTRTPQSRNSPSRRPARTPQTTTDGPLSTRTRNARSARSSGVTVDLKSAESGPGTRSHKRRRLSRPADTPKQSSTKATPNLIRAGSPSTAQRRRREFSIATDEIMTETNDTLEARDSVAQMLRDQSPLFVPTSEPGQENAEPPADVRSTSSDDVDVEIGQRNPALDNGLDSSSAPKETSTKRRRNTSRHSAIATAIADPVQVAPVRKDAQNRAPGRPPSKDLALAGRIDRWSRVPRHARGGSDRPSSSREPSPSNENETDEDDSYVQTSSPAPETPAATNITRKPKRARADPDDDGRPTRNVKRKPTFPILTHRLTHPSSLPTIPEEADDVDTSQAQSEDMGRFQDRAQPNAVDVLAQICRETIAALVGKISENAPRGRRKTVTSEREALEAFGRDLDDELFNMSEAVENRLELEGRVRKSRREKSALQAEWLEVRRERERVALQCDGVRRRHWEQEHDARKKWLLSEAARRAELEIDRQEPGEPESLEFLARSVLDKVSSYSDQGGLLDRLRSFNHQLETVVLSLHEEDP